MKEVISNNTRIHPWEKNKSLSPYKIIRPYVSSTFSDLEEEFKFLHSQVFPKLNEWCRERGCHFAPVDVRRTAVDFRTSSDYILKTALDNVAHARPYFMCIIGNRYGPYRSSSAKLLSSMPASQRTANQTAMDRNIITAAQHGHPWVIEPAYQYCSIMELEILLAAFKDNPSIPCHCFFYVKDFHNVLPANGNYNPNDKSEQFSTSVELEDAESEDRLNDLKRRVVNKGLPIKYFRTKEELHNAVFQDWSELIAKLCPVLHPSITDGESSIQIWSDHKLVSQLQNKYHRYHALGQLEEMISSHVLNATSDGQNYASENERMVAWESDDHSIHQRSGDGLFTPSASFIQSLQPPATIMKSKAQIFVLVGDPGSGKSTLLANWLNGFQRNNPTTLIISTFVGSSYLSYDLSVFMCRCISVLRSNTWNTRSLPSEVLDDVQSYDGLVETFASCLQLQPCLILIDSINDIKDGMHQDIGVIKGLKWLPKTIPPSCRIVVSTRRSDLTFKALQQRPDVVVHKMPPIDLHTREEIFHLHFGDNVVGVLGRDRLEKVWTNRLSERPLYLATLSHLIRSCRSTRDIDQVIDKCSTFRIFRDFWKSVFLLWSRRYSWGKLSSGQPGSIRHRGNAAGWVGDALKFIAVSRSGLFLSEILHLLLLVGYRGRAVVTPHDWGMFRAAAGNALSTSHDGRIGIAHDDVKLALDHCLLGVGTYSTANSSDHKFQQYHAHLATYFINHGSMDRKLVELPWHFFQCKDWVLLCQVLCKPRFFIAMCEHSRFNPSLYNDHLMYWRELSRFDFNIAHCLPSMLASHLPRGESLQNVNFLQPEQPGSDGNVLRASSVMKVPSLIIVTQHDDIAASHYRSTESRSGTEDREQSETESCSFFITEPDLENHLSVGGWSAMEEDPKITIDSASLTPNELSQLHYEASWLLFQFGAEHSVGALALLKQCRLHIEHNRPLTSLEQLVLFESIHLESLHTSTSTTKDLQLAINIYDSLPLPTMELGYNKLRDLLEKKGAVCLRFAEQLTDEREEEKAHALFMVGYNSMKKCGSVCGQAVATAIFGKLLASQDELDQAEVMLRKSLCTCLYWHGSKHVRVAGLLRDLGKLYSANFGYPQRKAMFTYKQALDIFQYHGRTLETPDLFNKIGELLYEEGTLRSKEEALSCFQQSFDTIVTEKSPTDSMLHQCSRNIRQASLDLSNGRFAFGRAVAQDKRDTDRPYSAMSWHSNELSRKIQSRCSSCSPVNSVRSSRKGSIKQTNRPYSSYSARSYANRVVLTPRVKTERQVKSAGAKFRCSPRSSSDPGSAHLKPVAHKVEEYKVVTTGTDGEETSVVIVHGNSPRSIISEGGSTQTKYQSISPRILSKNSIRNSQQIHPGSSRLCLKVHGSHSKLSDLLPPPISPRSAPATSLHHQSAWYNVPGRYIRPGEVLPSKRSQKRPLSTGRSSLYEQHGTSARSSPTHRSSHI